MLNPFQLSVKMGVLGGFDNPVQLLDTAGSGKPRNLNAHRERIRFLADWRGFTEGGIVEALGG